MNNITIDVIGAIVAKAMNKKLTITAYRHEYMSEITIYDENDHRFNFQIHINDEDEKEFSLYTDNGSILNVKIESESFILKFKLLAEDCINYAKSMALRDIENFLVEDQKDNKPTDISDLDNEDD
jgi:hypothetical protein